MCLEEVDLLGHDPGRLARRGNDLLLRPPVRRSDPVLRPSLLTALPLITASIGKPAATASCRRRSTTTATPSPLPIPSALPLNGLQRPSGAARPAFESKTFSAGVSVRLTPAATA